MSKPSNLAIVRPDPGDGAAVADPSLDALVLMLMCCEVAALRATVARHESRLRALEAQPS